MNNQVSGKTTNLVGSQITKEMVLESLNKKRFDCFFEKVVKFISVDFIKYDESVNTFDFYDLVKISGKVLVDYETYTFEIISKNRLQSFVYNNYIPEYIENNYETNQETLGLIFGLIENTIESIGNFLYYVSGSDSIESTEILESYSENIGFTCCDCLFSAEKYFNNSFIGFTLINE